jgi:hypothetical protein
MPIAQAPTRIAPIVGTVTSALLADQAAGTLASLDQVADQLAQLARAVERLGASREWSATQLRWASDGITDAQERLAKAIQTLGSGE